MSELTVRDLVVRLGGCEILGGVALDVPSGAVAAVLGPSGCGKTTLLRAVAGFVQPERGSVRIGERVVCDDATRLPPEQRGVGLVPQEGALFPHLDVAGNVAFGLARGERRAASGRARVAEVLELVGLPGFAPRRVAELSGGQQQRVALARALAPRPSIVLLDEPFSALDAGLRDSVRRQVRDAIDADGATAVLVTHDQDEALSFADTVAVMEQGRVVMQAPPAQVYAAPTHLAVARFVGHAVELPARVRDGVAECALGRVPLEGEPTRSAEGVVMLRPEQLRLTPCDAQCPVGVSVASGAAPHGRVVAADYFGHDALVVVELDAPGGAPPVQVHARVLGAPPVAERVRVEVAGAARFFSG